LFSACKEKILQAQADEAKRLTLAEKRNMLREKDNADMKEKERIEKEIELFHLNNAGV